MCTVPSSVPHREYCQAQHRPWWIPCSICSQMDTGPTWSCTHHTVHFLYFCGMKSSCEVAPTAWSQPHLHDLNGITQSVPDCLQVTSMKRWPSSLRRLSFIACPAQLVSLGAQVCADLHTLGPYSHSNMSWALCSAQGHLLGEGRCPQHEPAGNTDHHLQICRRKLSWTPNVDSYKSKYLFSNWWKRSSCKEKIYLYLQRTLFLQSWWSILLYEQVC